MQLRHFLPVFWRHQMNGPLARNSTDDSILGHDVHPAAGKDGFVMTTNGVKIEEPLVINVPNDETQLIHMPGQHQRRAGRTIQSRKYIAHAVLNIFITGAAEVLFQHFAGFLFVTGRGAGFQQIRQ